jgi:hypothetical protein
MVVILQLLRGEDHAEPLDISKKKYFSFPQPADVKKFRKRGHRMI